MDLFKELGEALNPQSIQKDLRELNKINYDYDHDEDGNMISCCGAVLDPDIMICPICKEHN